MEWNTRTLHEHERGELTRHLLALDAADRRLRFGLPRGDASIQEYAQRIDFDRDAVFGVFDDEAVLVGAAHLARTARFAEVGLSVLRAHRGVGIGGALLARSRLHARNWGVAELLVHCAADNAAMLRLARRHGMRARVERGEADATLAVPAPDPSSLAAELLAERIGTFDHAIKRQLNNARRTARALHAS